MSKPFFPSAHTENRCQFHRRDSHWFHSLQAMFSEILICLPSLHHLSRRSRQWTRVSGVQRQIARCVLFWNMRFSLCAIKLIFLRFRLSASVWKAIKSKQNIEPRPRSTEIPEWNQLSLSKKCLPGNSSGTASSECLSVLATTYFFVPRKNVFLFNFKVSVVELNLFLHFCLIFSYERDTKWITFDILFGAQQWRTQAGRLPERQHPEPSQLSVA